jgi:glycosyltransferase involved in cell wall biosynthesis
MTDFNQSLNPEQRPDITIVVSTLRRAGLLERLLTSICDLQVSGGTFEVVVVDNSKEGDRPTQELCQSERFKLAFDLKYVHQPKIGLNEARNYGIRNARADWVGFIDDDETLPPDWLTRALVIARSHSPDCFGGPYLPYYVGDKPAWFKDKYLQIKRGETAGWLDKGATLLGGNMIFQRRWLEELGGFNTKVGRIGNNLGYGDESEIMTRMAEKGARFWYDPDLFILHYASPENMTVRWFLRSKWKRGKAYAAFRFRDPAWRDNRPRLRVVLTGLKLLAMKSLGIGISYLKLPFRDRRAYPYAQNYILEVVCPQITGLGSAWQALQLNLDRRDVRVN